MTVIDTSTDSATTVADPVGRVRADLVLGTDISHATNIDDALKIAGLDWGITTVDGDTGISVIGDDGEYSAFAPNRKLLLRDDKPIVLGMVGATSYTVVENRTAFALADNARSMGAVFTAAGELDFGRKTFVTMNLPEAGIVIGGKDAISFDLRFRADHAGTGAVTMELEGTRLWCLNGCTTRLSLPIRWVIRHCSSAEERIAAVSTAMRGAFRYAKEFAALGERLISSPMRLDDYLVYIDQLYPRPDDARKAAVTRWEKRRSDLIGLYRTSQLQQDAPGTAWSAVAAATEYDQWFRNARSPESRARRQFTAGEDSFTTRAFGLIREMADA
ncbi:DUF932 domain-containing protein [Gordonia otitidis]|uniref:Uncharacterized protein n=1 Tax=Gordonia otitidis (strain DSM 44809 / CCUG 52243 / JCM 12355 / NBRC 100426 / IFM 10032) TaxID=1108044 RepID=H5TS11_GORO1|nr:DUF932 domain-containing protein [Gordonia otitidis]GAB36269.1 hypothetical protein GOOTI_206_00020 [Gordonia otitidis NBRC 100426]